MAWILVLFLIPLVGLVLYFLFSQNISRHRIFRLTEKEEFMMTTALRRQKTEIADGSFDFHCREAKDWRDLVLLNQNYGRAYYTMDNRVELLTDGEQLADRLLDDIRAAQSSIHIMFFIVKPDEVGRRLIDALTEKAAAGVEVLFLVDALGSRYITDHLMKEFRAAGGRFARFFPPRLRIFQYVNPKLNYRNHRKLVAIDDRVAYIGGYNIAREYMGRKKKFGYWRDTHIRIEGGATQDINFRFLMDWRASVRSEVRVTDVFFPPAEAPGSTGMQIVSCGPDSRHDQVKRAFLKMISSARRRVWIQTPYFVPDAPILESLKMAAQSGVDVRIMIPCMPDHIFVYWATWSYCAELLRDGGRIFIYDNGFLHAKTMTVDGEVSTVGSTNFDRRSFRLNFECNAFIYEKEMAQTMEKTYLRDLEHCHELTPELYARRSWRIKFKEPIARLLSDVL